ncbi:MAG: DUF177 domain-containing protein [Deltaproteobacteria bacterium]|nr:DUF177 domain-containing protein [Deltaproteobacteria bacterium]
MKTIPLKHILATQGLTITLDPNEDWLGNILDTIFAGLNLDKKNFRGKIKLRKTNQVVDITGDLNITTHPPCAHCGNETKWTGHLHFQTHQIPFPTDKPDNTKHDDAEDADTEDDEAIYYKNEEIQLDTIINDELALQLPYNYYCTDPSRCKLELPEDPHISLNDNTDPRWAPLKDLKITKG